MQTIMLSDTRIEKLLKVVRECDGIMNDMVNILGIMYRDEEGVMVLKPAKEIAEEDIAIGFDRTQEALEKIASIKEYLTELKR